MGRVVLWGGLFYGVGGFKWMSRRVYGAGCSMWWVDLSVCEQEGLWGGLFYGVGGFKCG